MSLILTQAEVREVDRIAIEQFDVPGVVLMENAGRGCAELLLAQTPTRTVTVVAGKGNNAGDGFVIARFLHNRHVDVRLLLLSSPGQFTGDAAINWNIAAKMEIPFLQIDSENETEAMSQLKKSDWIVDALLGTGLKGEVREPFRSLITRINSMRESGVKILAVDIPSGLHCDTGEVLGEAICADLTATFVALKPGLLKGEGTKRAGEIHVVEIGVPRAAIEQAMQN